MELDQDLLLNGMNYFKFLKLIRTRYEQTTLINLIEDMIQGMYKKKNKSEALSPLETLLTNEIIKIMQVQNIHKNKIKTEKFLNSLLASVKDLPSLKISIAIEPDQKLIDSIKSWSEKNNLEGTIFEFTIDPKILGGAIIVNSKGTYADYSLLKRIDDLFLNQKQTISKLL